MKSKGGSQNRFIRILTLPWKALTKARDCYVGSMTNYTVVNPRSLPKSYSVTSSRSSNYSESEDFRELVRAASCRGMAHENLDMNALIRQQIIQQLQQQQMRASSSRKVPRSCSVGMGKIEEDKPYVLGEDEAEDVMVVIKKDFKYPRSRSYAVTKKTNLAF